MINSNNEIEEPLSAFQYAATSMTLEETRAFKEFRAIGDAHKGEEFFKNVFRERRGVMHVITGGRRSGKTILKRRSLVHALLYALGRSARLVSGDVFRAETYKNTGVQITARRPMLIRCSCARCTSLTRQTSRTA